MGHILNDEDADELVKSKWKYKWEMPANEKLMSKWVGTGEPLPMVFSNHAVTKKVSLFLPKFIDIFCRIVFCISSHAISKFSLILSF